MAGSHVLSDFLGERTMSYSGSGNTGGAPNAGGPSNAGGASSAGGAWRNDGGVPPHAFDPDLEPELFRGVLTRRVFAFLIDLVVLSVPVILGYGFIARAIHVKMQKTDAAARTLFLYSIFYLFALFSFLVVDKVVDKYVLLALT